MEKIMSNVPNDPEAQADNSKHAFSNPDKDTLNAYLIIDELNVSGRWKDIFRRIYIAYYNNFHQGSVNNSHFWEYSPAVFMLPGNKKFNFFTSFNFFALLFGPFYYFAKGMFLKGTILVVLSYFITINKFFDIPGLNFLPFVFLYCCIFANRDYFISKVLKHPKVKSDPVSLNSFYDESFYESVAERKNIAPVLKTAMVLGVALLVWHFAQNVQNVHFTLSTAQASLYDDIPKVCLTRESCAVFIMDTTAKIQASKSIDKEYKKNYDLGCAYALIGDKESAIKYLNLAYKQSNQHGTIFDHFKPKNALITKAAVQSFYRDYYSALKTYRYLYNSSVDSRIWFFYIGRTHLKLGQYKEAINNLSSAVNYFPANPVYRETLGYARAYSGDYKGAIEDLYKAMELYEAKKASQAKINSVKRYIESLASHA